MDKQRSLGRRSDPSQERSDWWNAKAQDAKVPPWVGMASWIALFLMVFFYLNSGGQSEKPPIAKAKQAGVTSKKVAEKQTEQKPQTIPVSIKIEIEKNAAGRVRIYGQTNLPDQMKFMVTLSNEQLQYRAQSHVVAKDGRFQSEWFTRRGNPVPTGNYTVELSSPLTQLQPKSVQLVIGEKGQYLTGNGVVTTQFGGKRIDWVERKPIS